MFYWLHINQKDEKGAQILLRMQSENKIAQETKTHAEILHLSNVSSKNSIHE